MNRRRLALALPLTAITCHASAQDPPTAVAFAQAEFVCDGLFRTGVHVDGLQTDWEAEADPVDRVADRIAGEAEYDWTGPADASFRFWCRFAHDWIYFAVVGRDNVLLSPEGRSNGDRLEIWLGAGEGGSPVRIDVPLWVAHDTGRVTPTWGHGGEGTLGASVAEVALRENGFFAEIGIAMSDLPELAPLFGAMPAAIVQRDIDRDGSGEREVGIATAPVNEDAIGGVLRTNVVERRLGEISRQLMFDANARGDRAHEVWAELGGRRGLDLAFLLGDMLIVTGEGFDDFAWTATTLRTSDDHSAISLHAVDLDGDGVSELIYRFARRIRRLEDEGVIVQEVVLGYSLEGSALTRIFAQEVANELVGHWRIESPITFRPTRDGQIVEFGRPVSEVLVENYFDVDADDATDYERMLLPWDADERIEWTTRDGSSSATRR